MKYANTVSLYTEREESQQSVVANHPHVLMIDDDPALGFLARQVLEKKSYIVHVASHAEHALEVINNHDISCILLDLTMPDVHGFELCQLIKLSDKGKDIPVIVVSGKFDNATVERVFRLGAVDFVRKPVNWRILLNRISFMLDYNSQKSQLAAHQQHISSLYSSLPD